LKVPVEIQKLITAVEKAKANSGKRAFTQAVDLIVKLRDVDIKKPENRINELIELPNPFGKPVKICVIASGALSVNAKKAAADLVLEKEDLERISKDKKAAKKLANDYDFFIAEAPLMPIVGKTLGAVLGPRGKMPTPIPPNAQIEPILAKHRKMVRVRTRDQPIIQCRIGTEDLPNEKIADNAKVVLTRLEEKLENGLKNVKEVRIKTTMGQLVKIEF
jgi:large subunit ribosomal protein L1